MNYIFGTPYQKYSDVFGSIVWVCWYAVEQPNGIVESFCLTQTSETLLQEKIEEIKEMLRKTK